MKYIFYLLFFAQIAQAQQSRFREGETLYVWALSGLNMRKLPDAKSEKIAALPYGKKVTVQSNIGIIVAHEVEEFKDFKVKGVWLLVKYGDKEGFVFDGYMSRLVAPEKTKDDWFDINSYIEKKFEKVRKPTFSPYENSKKEVTITEKEFENRSKGEGTYSHLYENSIKISNSHDSNSAWGEISIDSMTLYEGYIFTKLLGSQFGFEFNKKKNIFEFTRELCSYKIFLKNNQLIIDWECHC